MDQETQIPIISRVIIFDGTREYEGEEILSNTSFVNCMIEENTYYEPFVDEINACGAVLYINASAIPVSHIKYATVELTSKLKAAGLDCGG